MALHDEIFDFLKLTNQGYREMYGLAPLTKTHDKRLIDIRFENIKRIAGEMDNQVIPGLIDAHQKLAELKGGNMDDYHETFERMPTMHKDGIADIVEKYPGEMKFIDTVTSKLAEPGAAAFYFEDVDMRDDTVFPLIDTAVEFFKEGVLRLPYPRCLFIFRYSKLGMFVPAYAEEIEGGLRIICFVRDHARLKDNPAWVLPSVAVDYMRANAGPFKGGGLFVEHVDAKALFAPPECSPDELKSLLGESVLYTLMGCLMLGMPHYTKQQVDIDRKLARAREKNGKTPLAGYTVVRFRESISRGMGDGEGGWSVKPHWRRGHIRTLQTGRKVAVSPCMVNFEGEGDLPKNVYMVEGRQDEK